MRASTPDSSCASRETQNDGGQCWTAVAPARLQTGCEKRAELLVYRPGSEKRAELSGTHARLAPPRVMLIWMYQPINALRRQRLPRYLFSSEPSRIAYCC
jgi:hypothetical protein